MRYRLGRLSVTEVGEIVNERWLGRLSVRVGRVDCQ